MPVHHIIPKHEWKRRFGNLKGVNAIDNLVDLTIEQHTEAHKRMADDGSPYDQIAYRMMTKQIGKEEAIKLAGRLANTGKKFSTEARKRMSESAKGLRIGNQNAAGYKHTEEWKKESSQRMTGRIRGSYKPETKHRKTFGKKRQYTQHISSLHTNMSRFG